MYVVICLILCEVVVCLVLGIGLWDGLECILCGCIGVLIVLGYDENVEVICDGGFFFDVCYVVIWLCELCKMDGVVVLFIDGSCIVWVNV